MAEAFLLNQKKLLPCAAYLNGQYGLKNMYMGVPTIIGSKGIEKIIEVKISAKEKSMLKKSVKSVQGLVSAVEKIFSLTAKRVNRKNNIKPMRGGYRI